MKYYAVVYHYENGAEYSEDLIEYKHNIVVCPTEDIAREYIAKYCVPEYTEDDEFDGAHQWKEINVDEDVDYYYGKEPVRIFKRPYYCWEKDIEKTWYTIETVDAYDGSEEEK